VHLRDGAYECSYCGTVLEVRPGEVPQFVIVAPANESIVRVLFLHRHEIHRCSVDVPEPRS
jgi:hypothetical protein